MSTGDEKLINAITNYESLCDKCRAQSQEAKGELLYIKNALSYRGMEYNTLNLAKYGSKRSLDYIKRGLIDGYSLSESGEIVKTR
ncbi:hypothetical protein PEC301619_24460 [Pectobacterium carotovorum subsp. carotovorum]|nr:hypothetical protein PEC301619_24460 [Pectobacterium carotovorum subsp. carotovorum]